MTYRVSVFEYMEIPKNVLHETVEGSKEEAVERAKTVLLKSDGDVVVVALVEGGETKVVHRFEKTKMAS